MSTINYAEQGTPGQGAKLYLWETLTETNVDGQPLELVDFPYRCVQVTGTLGGAVLSIQGSNDWDGTTGTWFTLKTSGDADADFSTAGGAQLVILPRYLRPFVTGGSGTDLDVWLYCKRFLGRN